MIFIKPACRWNLRDFIAAYSIYLQAEGKDADWWRHLSWWFIEGNWHSMFFLLSKRTRIGYVRATSTGIVSIAIQPSYQQQGHGIALLRHLRARVPGTLIAFIKKENTASRSLFLRAGYTEIHRLNPLSQEYIFMVHYGAEIEKGDRDGRNRAWKLPGM